MGDGIMTLAGRYPSRGDQFQAAGPFRQQVIYEHHQRDRSVRFDGQRKDPTKTNCRGARAYRHKDSYGNGFPSYPHRGAL